MIFDWHKDGMKHRQSRNALSDGAYTSISDRDQYGKWYSVQQDGKHYTVRPTTQTPTELVKILPSEISRYPTKIAAAKAAKTRIKTYLLARTSMAEDTMNSKFANNTQLAEKAIRTIAKKYDGKVGITWSQSQNRGKRPARYMRVHFNGIVHPFEIRIADHLTYGQFHTGDLPYKNYAVETLTATAIYSAFSAYKKRHNLTPKPKD